MTNCPNCSYTLIQMAAVNIQQHLYYKDINKWDAYASSFHTIWHHFDETTIFLIHTPWLIYETVSHFLSEEKEQ